MGGDCEGEPMSILIPGKMPTRCWDCPMCYDMIACTLTGLNWYRDTVDLSIDPAEERMPNCPLIELPPHGRLVDVDALNLDYEVEMADDWKTAHEIANVVKYAPTIVPAEEG